MWLKALSAVGALICAFGLTHYLGLEPTCAYKACQAGLEVIKDI